MVYSRKKAILIIVISSLLVSGTTGAALLFFKFQDYTLASSEKGKICAIVQTGPKYEALKNHFLAETLALSKDRPTSLYHFDTTSALSKLLSTHVIEKAKVKKIKPDTLYIDYQIREPLFSYRDLSNTYLDRQGILFPGYPFYTPKKVPELYLGNNRLKWGGRVPEEKLQVALTLLEKLKGFQLLRIDLSSIDLNLGRREIIVIIKVKEGVHTLRLPRESFEEQLKNYFLIGKETLGKSAIIDLRLPGVAYLTQN